MRASWERRRCREAMGDDWGREAGSGGAVYRNSLWVESYIKWKRESTAALHLPESRRGVWERGLSKGDVGRSGRHAGRHLLRILGGLEAQVFVVEARGDDAVVEGDPASGTLQCADGEGTG